MAKENTVTLDLEDQNYSKETSVTCNTMSCHTSFPNRLPCLDNSSIQLLFIAGTSGHFTKWEQLQDKFAK